MHVLPTLGDSLCSKVTQLTHDSDVIRGDGKTSTIRGWEVINNFAHIS